MLACCAAVYLLLWNEGRAVQHARGVAAGLAGVVTIDPRRVDAAHDQKLVHVVGQATVEGTLADPLFGLTAPAVKLLRQVEMYQWEERKHEAPAPHSPGDAVVTWLYPKVWSSKIIFSGGFHESQQHANPTEFKLHEAEQVANNVTVGAMTLSPGLINQFNSYEPLPLTEQDAARLPAALHRQFKLFEGMLYQSQDPQHPAVGDVRIKFLVVKPARVSLIARQSGNTFVAWRSGDKSQPDLERLVVGEQTAADLYVAVVQTNSWLTWGLRGALFGLLWFGGTWVFKPVEFVGAFIPYVAELLGLGVRWCSFLMAAVVELVIVGIAWVGERPIVAIAAWLAAAAMTGFTFRRARRVPEATLSRAATAK